MIKILGAIIDHRHNIGVIVFVVIIEGIEDDTETVPAVGGTEHLASVLATLGCVPEGLWEVRGMQV